MTKKALTALKLSIEHWERLSTGKRERGEVPDAINCALCQQFNLNVRYDEECKGCPIYTKTKEPYCYNTPYKHANLMALDVHGDYIDSKLRTKKFKDAAKVQLEFLKSLLPK